MTSASKREAQHTGLRRAMEIYRSASEVFDETELQTEYLNAVARELRRLLREPPRW